MITGKYPMLEIDLKKFKNNIDYVISRCKMENIEVAGVIKGFNALHPISKIYCESEFKQIASSRIEQLKIVKEINEKTETMMIRLPMLSQVEDVIKYVDISLNSEIQTLMALNDEAKRQNKIHKVILMSDLGDLREGYRNIDEILEVSKSIESMKNLNLAGIATNLGCYGSILATKEKLEELVKIAGLIENEIGRTLDIISGGSTTSFMRILDGDMPKEINHLRIGEHIVYGKDLRDFYGYDIEEIQSDIFNLKCEVIEIKEKETYPIGEITIDAFGRKQKYIDRGFRKRAIVAIGKVDLVSFDDIFPKDKGIDIIGGSSDHCILDIENCNKDIKVGDILEFSINYASGVYLTASENVKKRYI